VGQGEVLDICGRIRARLGANSRLSWVKRSSDRAQIDDFAAGSWIVRQVPQTLDIPARDFLEKVGIFRRLV
jgi:hypothetical protein